MDDRLPDLIDLVRNRTPARLLVGRSGSSYRTRTQLDLREDHAAARDAVRAEMDLGRDFSPAFHSARVLMLASSRATSKAEYLLRPDLGRRLSDSSVNELNRDCFRGADLQIVIGDGLSPAAVAAQVPRLLPLLEAGAKERGWSTGLVFFVQYCRVGILNDIGEILDPKVVVLLIGERPGLATADSLSAYLAYRPREGQTDAHRNLISNIHARGTSPEDAAGRILGLAAQMMARKESGVAIKEVARALPGDGPGG